MLSLTAEYALRAMVYLATTYPRPCTGSEIAAATRVAPGYLAKIMHGLGRQNLVDSQRGKRGGFVLVRPPAEMTLFEIVEAVDPIPRVLVCPRNVPEHCEELCPLHRFLDDQVVHIHESLRATTLAALADGNPRTFPNVS